MLNKLLLLLLAAGVVLWGASVAFKGMGPRPEVVFEALLDASTDRVSDFDGFIRRGASGYDSHLRFRATDDWIASLPYLGFREADCAEVRQHVHFAPLRVATWPPWYPEALENVACYERLGENAWSPRGRDYVLAEPDGGWVYFSGSGPKRDRVMPDEP